MKRLLLTVLLSILSACGRPDNAVKIAVVMPLTGDTGSEGQGLVRAIRLAFEEANASGRLPFKVEAVAFDDRADPKEAVHVANMIAANPRIVAVIGHYNSGCAIPSAKVYAKVPLALVTPATSNPEVTAQQIRPEWTGAKVAFRICPTDDAQGGFAGRYVAEKLELKRLCLIHDKTAYGQGLAGEFLKGFAAGGGTILSHDGISVGDKDFKALLTRLRSLYPEGIYFAGLYTEAGLIVRQMRELGMKMPFFSADGTRTPAFFDIAGTAADGTYLTQGGIPVERLAGAKGFVEAYNKRWKGETIHPFDHYGYEAAGIVVDALAKVGPDRAKLLQVLPKTSYRGILGLTEFDSKGDRRESAIVMTRAVFKDKSFPVVEP